MVLFRIFIVSFFILYCPQAFSKIEITDVVGASNWEYEEYDGNSLIIWAGLAGPSTCNNGVCDNCNGGLGDCNRNRIDEDGYLTIHFRSDVRPGIPLITDANNRSTPLGERNITIPVNANDPASSRVAWSRICTQPNADNCTGNAQLTLLVGIDGSNNGQGNVSLDNDAEDDSLSFTVYIRKRLPQEGINTFSLFPGDEKVIMLTPADEGAGEFGPKKIDEHPPIIFPNGFPTYDGTRITYIRFYYVEVPNGEEGCSIDERGIGNNSDYVETEVIDLLEGSSKVELSNLYFTKTNQRNTFKNNVTYVFKIALVDEAGNVGRFNTSCDPVTHVITPSEVHGLLPGCFIATAAYGESHKILETFYQFRDQKLLPYTLGKLIHNLYYIYSPPLANIIQDNVLLKYMARISLIPFWIYAFLALQIGHILTFFLLASFTSILIYFFIKKNVII